MTNQQPAPSWMEEPSVRDIPKEKLDFLQKLVFESKTLSQKELLPFLMALAQRSKEEKISFSQEEMNAIIEAIKKYSTPDEIAKINQLMKLLAQKH
ncbi:MAG: hypothetical protein Q4C58_05600 [Eubacteriales bacterium]|nr:hypothetical protein [Eubacteriales bacterium]